MSLLDDLDLIDSQVLPRDPSFRGVAADSLAQHLTAARACAQANKRQAFLLAAMRLLALPANGHTRLIPNDAISVLPLRLVTLGTEIRLAEADGRFPKRLIAINGVPVAQIEAAARPYLAGSRQRQRVIGPLLMVWPAALEILGVTTKDTPLTYTFEDKGGNRTDLQLNPRHVVPAQTLYPRNEHGRACPDGSLNVFAQSHDLGQTGLALSLPSFFDPTEAALTGAIQDAASLVSTRADAPLLLDLRGNTGGDFIKTSPLIDAISASDPARPVTVLVDKFTFSAAIVFVVLLRHRLGARLRILGEDMGDALTFFAEGGTLDLPASGAAVRYATAFHDWAGGTADETTPDEIKRHLVAVGAMGIDGPWVQDPDTSRPFPEIARELLDA